jgi:hypothetical protein
LGGPRGWGQPGCSLHVVDRGRVEADTATGFIVTAVEGLAAEHYRRVISEKTRDALARLPAQGRRVSRWAPYGFRFGPGGRLVADAKEIAVARRIGCWRRRGCPCGRFPGSSPQNVFWPGAADPSPHDPDHRVEDGEWGLKQVAHAFDDSAGHGPDIERLRQLTGDVRQGRGPGSCSTFLSHKLPPLVFSVALSASGHSLPSGSR